MVHCCLDAVEEKGGPRALLRSGCRVARSAAPKACRVDGLPGAVPRGGAEGRAS